MKKNLCLLLLLFSTSTLRTYTPPAASPFDRLACSGIPRRSCSNSQQLRKEIMLTKTYTLITLFFAMQISPSYEDWYGHESHFFGNVFIYRLLDNITFLDIFIDQQHIPTLTLHSSFLTKCLFEAIETTLAWVMPKIENRKLMLHLKKIYNESNPDVPGHFGADYIAFDDLPICTHTIQSLITLLHKQLHALSQTLPGLLKYPMLPHNFNELMNQSSSRKLKELQESRWHKVFKREQDINRWILDDRFYGLNYILFNDLFSWIRQHAHNYIIETRSHDAQYVLSTHANFEKLVTNFHNKLLAATKTYTPQEDGPITIDHIVES